MCVHTRSHACSKPHAMTRHGERSRPARAAGTAPGGPPTPSPPGPHSALPGDGRGPISRVSKKARKQASEGHSGAAGAPDLWSTGILTPPSPPDSVDAEEAFPPRHKTPWKEKPSSLIEVVFRSFTRVHVPGWGAGGEGSISFCLMGSDHSEWKRFRRSCPRGNRGGDRWGRGTDAGCAAPMPRACSGL